MRDKRLTVSMSPHLRHGRTVRSMILLTIIALLPATLWGFYQFGLPAVILVVAGIAAALVTETVVTKLAGQPLEIGNGHAVLVGLTLALLMPAGAPWWLVVVGAGLAILVGKMPFGPLGGAPISPALVGLLIVAISWPGEITRFVQPRTAPPELQSAQAAPAESSQQAVMIDPSDAAEYDAADLFWGNQVGPIGAISPLLLLFGGLFLIWRRAARWQGALGFLLGLGLSAAIAHAVDPGGNAAATFHLLTGIVFFGAFFLCTDWTSTPVTPWGLFLFGLFAGALAFILRLSGLPYARVPFAIVLMSLATPLFDRIATTPFGKVVRHA